MKYKFIILYALTTLLMQNFAYSQESNDGIHNSAASFANQLHSQGLSGKWGQSSENQKEIAPSSQKPSLPQFELNDDKSQNQITQTDKAQALQLSTQDNSYVVKGNSANVRTAPSLKAKILGTIPGGAVVSVTNTDNPEWWLVSYYGNEGYISSKLLIKIEESDQYKDWQKESASTGDNPECENISQEYDDSMDNKLLIHVGYHSDVVVKLMKYSGICMRIVYIKAGDNYSIRNIPEGYYYLKIAYGKDFRKYMQNGQCIVKFMIDPTYEIGEERLDYYKVKRPNFVDGNYEYERWQVPSYELSLNIEYTKGSFNDFHSKKVSEAEFNR